MSGSIAAEIEVDGVKFEARYDEGAGLWVCEEFNLSAPQIKSLRAKLAVIGLDRRRINVPVLLTSVFGWVGEFSEGVATLIAGDYVWVEHERGGKIDRRKFKFNELSLPSPEVKEQLDRAATLRSKAQAATRAAAEIIRSIPRVTEESLLAAHAFGAKKMGI